MGKPFSRIHFSTFMVLEAVLEIVIVAAMWAPILPFVPIMTDFFPLATLWLLARQDIGFVLECCASQGSVRKDLHSSHARQLCCSYSNLMARCSACTAMRDRSLLLRAKDR